MSGDFEREPNFFTSTSDLIQVLDKKILVRMLKMDGSTLIFLNNSELECVDEIAVAMPVRGKKEVISSIVLGSSEMNAESKWLAEKLTKRFGRQFFVSFNLEWDLTNRKNIEEAIADYINGHIDQLA